MKTTSTPKLPGVFLSTASLVSFAIGVVLLFGVVLTSVQAQEVPQLCRENKGKWLEEYKECESASQQWCEAANGHFDECE
jgi:hypothetical protein